MYVKYVGPAMSRTIARHELGVKDPPEEGEDNLVWDPINGMVQEMTKEEFDNLGRLTYRGDWEEVEGLPDLPPVSVNVAPDQAFMPESGLGAADLPQDDEIVDVDESSGE